MESKSFINTSSSKQKFTSGMQDIILILIKLFKKEQMEEMCQKCLTLDFNINLMKLGLRLFCLVEYLIISFVFRTKLQCNHLKLYLNKKI